LQDAAVVTLPDGAVALLGGLDANDTSTSAVTVLAGNRVSMLAQLPLAQHDAQGALLGGKAYVFGGGQVSSYDHVLRLDPVTDSVSEVGVLPSRASDVAVTAARGDAYVIGGYTGERALDTILAWRPGQSAKLVARLPLSLRYAAAATIGGQVIIVGGSHGETAEDEILRFDPVSRSVTRIGRLPRPLTHASAVAFGSYLYVLGGRGTSPESQTSAILAINPLNGAVTLPLALSDAAASVARGQILIAGGHSSSGTQSSIFALEPRPGVSSG
jgi:N-acetylneuraminic acid mutarotase